MGASVDRLIAATGVSTAQIDRVFLTGGSALVPAVRRLFESDSARRRSPAAGSSPPSPRAWPYVRSVTSHRIDTHGPIEPPATASDQ